MECGMKLFDSLSKIGVLLYQPVESTDVRRNHRRKSVVTVKPKCFEFLPYHLTSVCIFFFIVGDTTEKRRYWKDRICGCALNMWHANGAGIMLIFASIAVNRIIYRCPRIFCLSINVLSPSLNFSHTILCVAMPCVNLELSEKLFWSIALFEIIYTSTNYRDCPPQAKQ